VAVEAEIRPWRPNVAMEAVLRPFEAACGRLGRDKALRPLEAMETEIKPHMAA
jgi:hypothetical protein